MKSKVWFGMVMNLGWNESSIGRMIAVSERNVFK